MINQLIRYAPALQLIRQAGFRKICEIGSGQNGICKFLDQQVVGIDIDFKDYREDGRIDIHPNLTPVFGDVLKGTGFADQEFDLALCVDMLEHLQKSDRERALRETLRIGRNAYIALPQGNHALACDRWLAGFLVRRGKTPPVWLYEHLDLEFPDEGEIEGILASIPDVEYQVMANDNIQFHKLIVLLEILKFGRLSERVSRWRITRTLLRPFNSGKAYRRIYLVSRTGVKNASGQNSGS